MAATDAEVLAASLADEDYQALVGALGRYEGLLVGDQKNRLLEAGLSDASSEHIDYQMSERSSTDLSPQAD